MRPWAARVLDVAPKTGVVFVALAQDVGDKILDGLPVLAVDRDTVCVVRLRQLATQVFVYPFDALRRERLRIKRFVGVNTKRAFRLIGAQAVGPHGVPRRIAGQTVVFEIGFDDLFGHIALRCLRESGACDG